MYVLSISAGYSHIHKCDSVRYRPRNISRTLTKNMFYPSMTEHRADSYAYSNVLITSCIRERLFSISLIPTVIIIIIQILHKRRLSRRDDGTRGDTLIRRCLPWCSVRILRPPRYVGLIYTDRIYIYTHGWLFSNRTTLIHRDTYIATRIYIANLLSHFVLKIALKKMCIFRVLCVCAYIR